VKYELGFYIAEDGILHSLCRENLNLTQLRIIAYGWSISFIAIGLQQPLIRRGNCAVETACCDDGGGDIGDADVGRKFINTTQFEDCVLDISQRNGSLRL
jgi:hypothetical protein